MRHMRVVLSWGILSCRGRQGKGGACQDPTCLYHMHIKTCGGDYIKIKGPELDKTDSAKPGQQAAGGAATKRGSKRASSEAVDGGAGAGPSGAAKKAAGTGAPAGPKPGLRGTPPITQWFKKAGPVAGKSGKHGHRGLINRQLCSTKQHGECPMLEMSAALLQQSIRPVD